MRNPGIYRRLWKGKYKKFSRWVQYPWYN